MSTTVHLTDQQLAEIQLLTREQDPSQAIQAAMVEYIRFARRSQLRDLPGKVHMEQTWRDADAAELRDRDASR